MTPTFSANSRLLKIDYTTMKKMKTKPVVSKSIINSKFKSKYINEFISTISKNKSSITITKSPQKTKTKQKLKF